MKKTRWTRIFLIALFAICLILGGCTPDRSPSPASVSAELSQPETSGAPKSSEDKQKPGAESSGSEESIKPEQGAAGEHDAEGAKASVERGKYYYDKDQVAAYLHEFKELPPNYITKKESRERGWKASPKAELVVGGDRFGNRESKLPTAKGRKYFEADVRAGYTNHRGPERLVFSNDGWIYYTSDHYENFTLLYEGEK